MEQCLASSGPNHLDFNPFQPFLLFQSFPDHEQLLSWAVGGLFQRNMTNNSNCIHQSYVGFGTKNHFSYLNIPLPVLNGQSTWVCHYLLCVDSVGLFLSTTCAQQQSMYLQRTLNRSWHKRPNFRCQSLILMLACSKRHLAPPTVLCSQY